MELKSAFDWKPLPGLIDEERDRQRAEKLARLTKEAEAYWNEIAPCGVPPVKLFTLADGVELLLYDLRRLPCQEQALTLEPGDLLVAYTDGIGEP